VSQRLPAALSGLLLGLSLALAPGLALAQAQAASELAPPQFADAAEQARFHTLTSELRCVMCQNQSLADSNAQIARDMRREVLSLMREGHDDAQIKRFLVDRYGEFVLYRPEVSSHTWLLWFGPGWCCSAAAWRYRGSCAAAPPVPPPPSNDKDDGGEQEW